MWQRHLPHLREELYGEGLYDFIGHYGFQAEEGEASSSEVMASLLEKAAEENREEENSETCSSPETSLPDIVHTYDDLNSGDEGEFLNTDGRFSASLLQSDRVVTMICSI